MKNSDFKFTIKKLYLDIDGVLLTTQETRAADSLSPFVDYIIDHFDCYWLTTHCKGDSESALKHLSNHLDYTTVEKLRVVKPTLWDTSKTEAIDFNSDFFWLDDQPFHYEIESLSRKSSIGKLIIVDLKRNDELKRVMSKLKSSLFSST